MCHNYWSLYSLYWSLWCIWKDPDAGKDWRQEKGTAENEMVGWHHQLNGHDMNLSKLWETVMDREAWHAAVQRVTKKHWDKVSWVIELNWTLQSNSYHFDLTFLYLQSSKYVLYYYFVRCIIVFLSALETQKPSFLLRFLYFYFYSLYFYSNDKKCKLFFDTWCLMNYFLMF